MWYKKSNWTGQGQDKHFILYILLQPKILYSFLCITQNPKIKDLFGWFGLRAISICVLILILIALRDQSWQCLGNYMWCWGFKLVSAICKARSRPTHCTVSLQSQKSKRIQNRNYKYFFYLGGLGLFVCLFYDYTSQVLIIYSGLCTQGWLLVVSGEIGNIGNLIRVNHTQDKCLNPCAISSVPCFYFFKWHTMVLGATTLCSDDHMQVQPGLARYKAINHFISVLSLWPLEIIY